jgi:hypothetical protein
MEMSWSGGVPHAFFTAALGRGVSSASCTDHSFEGQESAAITGEKVETRCSVSAVRHRGMSNKNEFL